MIRPRSAWERLQRRWVAGEPLDEQEERARLDLAQHELDANREFEFYERARGFLDETSSEEQADDARFLERLLERANPARAPSLRLVGDGGGATRSEEQAHARLKPRTAPKIAWLVGAAAAAALLALVMRYVWLAEPSTSAAHAPRPPAQVLVGCELASVAGVVTAGSVLQPAVGQRLAEGAVVATGAGRACLSIDGSVRVCLPSDSAIVLTSLNSNDLRVSVTRGRGIASLSKRAAGAVFSMNGNGVSATAHGTIFTFELGGDGRAVDVTVLEGSVEVRRAGAQALVQANSLARCDARAPIALLPSSDSDRQERFNWLNAAAPAAGLPAEPVVVDRPSTDAVARRQPNSAPALRRDALYAAARAQAKLGNPQAARALYRELVALYPGPSTAAVQVVLGNLEMELGAPERALAAFETYLPSGGPLEPEALHGKVRALRALGRKSAERTTIRNYLQRYPEGFQAPALKQRLADLE